MNAPASLRKGWCPSALRPMLAGDGLLLRIRLAGGRLRLDQAEAIADCAGRFGNGVIEISSRANLQLRGVTEAGLPDLQRRLDSLGLLDADASGERVRNVVASPISDLDPAALLDVGPIVAALETRLDEDASLHRLPPQFGFLIDGGGVLPLGDIAADIRFEALQGKDGARFDVVLSGADDVAASCAPRQIADVAAALVHAFQRLAASGPDAPRRMSGLVEREGASTIFAAAGLTTTTASSPSRHRAALRDLLGVRALGASFCVGAAPSLGRMTADGLRLVACAARRVSAADIRITPWRALIATGLDRERAKDFAAALQSQGFILDADDPRLAIVACSGAPACANAARPVQSEALELARSVAPGRGIVLHVSGCEKGCAHGRPAPFTLVARVSGYDLIVDGKASDRPAREALSIEAIASLLTREWGDAV